MAAVNLPSTEERLQKRLATEERLRKLTPRLQNLLPRLREADVKLEAALERMEDLFETELPEGAYGCMLLSHSRGTWTHLLYFDSILWVETWSKRHGFHCEDAINHDIRQNKIDACLRMQEMWILCGGDPARVGRKSSDPIGMDCHERP